MNFEVNLHRPLFLFVGYSHFHLVNSDCTYLAKSCTLIDCILGKRSKHIYE
jgi:hypothetical protein